MRGRILNSSGDTLTTNAYSVRMGGSGHYNRPRQNNDFSTQLQ